jgi:hypothetical protein
MQQAIQVKIARVEGLPGFAAYLAGSLSEHGKTTIDLEGKQALIVLDVQAVFDDETVVQEDGSPIPPRTPEERKRELVEHLTHEFGHVLEEHFNLEFDEDAMETIVASYKSNA